VSSAEEVQSVREFVERWGVDLKPQALELFEEELTARDAAVRAEAARELEALIASCRRLAHRVNEQITATDLAYKERDDAFNDGVEAAAQTANLYDGQLLYKLRGLKRARAPVPGAGGRVMRGMLTMRADPSMEGRLCARCGIPVTTETLRNCPSGSCPQGYREWRIIEADDLGSTRTSA
jgi:hypothetical protein